MAGSILERSLPGTAFIPKNGISEFKEEDEKTREDNSWDGDERSAEQLESELSLIEDSDKENGNPCLNCRGWFFPRKNARSFRTCCLCADCRKVFDKRLGRIK